MSKFAYLVSIVVLLLAAGLYFVSPARFSDNSASESRVMQAEARKVAKEKRFASLTDSLDTPDNSDVEISSLDAAAEPGSEEKTVTTMPEITSSLPNPGLSPLVNDQLNTHTRSVAEAFETGEHPERLTALVSPPPFDADAWLENPQAYLSVVEPGRIYQSAQPGPDVPGIEITSSGFNEVLQGEAVVFRVRVGPNDPVTFHSSDMGEFENRLSTITVPANSDGVAEVTFKTTTGMQGLANILAASPRTSGQAQFIVRVLLPEQTRTESSPPESKNDSNNNK